MLGERLRDLRLARGLTQGQIAELVGLQQPQVSAIEVGRRDTTTGVLLRWLEVCDAELVVHPRRNARAIDRLRTIAAGLTPEGLRDLLTLAGAWGRLTDRQRSAVLGIVQATAADGDQA